MLNLLKYGFGAADKVLGVSRRRKESHVAYGLTRKVTEDYFFPWLDSTDFRKVELHPLHLEALIDIQNRTWTASQEFTRYRWPYPVVRVDYTNDNTVDKFSGSDLSTYWDVSRRQLRSVTFWAKEFFYAGMIYIEGADEINDFGTDLIGEADLGIMGNRNIYLFTDKRAFPTT